MMNVGKCKQNVTNIDVTFQQRLATAELQAHRPSDLVAVRYNTLAICGCRVLRGGERRIATTHARRPGVDCFGHMSKPFVLRTDHKPLKSIFGPDKGIPEVSADRLQRYAIFLSVYNYKIEYVLSTEKIAVCSSRAATPGGAAADEVDLERAAYVSFVLAGATAAARARLWCSGVDAALERPAAARLVRAQFRPAPLRPLAPWTHPPNLKFYSIHLDFLVYIPERNCYVERQDFGEGRGDERQLKNATASASAAVETTNSPEGEQMTAGEEAELLSPVADEQEQWSSPHSGVTSSVDSEDVQEESSSDISSAVITPPPRYGTTLSSRPRYAKRRVNIKLKE
ncbi:hypothetical protein EVAR_89806_1 [Eumeta japonica]|uniref:Reverse transcriptase RNase H-like domain-containing protein n=1 Tax=Eumeta variegata TaxID=151549 RepID=A0A4C1YJF1_EUMVA|nr:hypothetical protein EVAR_89806_1 [Eumeta japonica]